jgi:hypothetical protein
MYQPKIAMDEIEIQEQAFAARGSNEQVPFFRRNDNANYGAEGTWVPWKSN